MRSLGSTPIAENISAYLVIDSLLFFAVPLGIYFYIGRNNEYCQSRKRKPRKAGVKSDGTTRTAAIPRFLCGGASGRRDQLCCPGRLGAESPSITMSVIRFRAQPLPNKRAWGMNEESNCVGRLPPSFPLWSGVWPKTATAALAWRRLERPLSYRPSTSFKRISARLSDGHTPRWKPNDFYIIIVSIHSQPRCPSGSGYQEFRRPPPTNRVG